MVPEGWSEKRLGSVLERVVVPVKPEPDALYREIGIRSHGKGIFHKKAVLGKTLGSKRVFKIIADCFVVNIVFAWEQAVARTTVNEAGMIASHRFPMYKPKESKCDIDFINYFFKTKKGKYLLELASPGGAGRNKTLGQKEFANLKFPMPGDNEQTKIVQILSTWDKAIETTKKLIENSKAQKKALMQQLLTGKKRFPGFYGKWKKTQLSAIANITMGSSPKSEAYNNDKAGLPLIQGNADIRNGFSSPRCFTSQTTKECNIDDILLSVRAPVGLVSISRHHACIGRGVAAINAKASSSTRFIYQLLLAHESRWMRLSQGTTFDAVNGSDIKKLHVYIPDEKSEQLHIAVALDGQDKVTENIEMQFAFLLEQKKALMQQLLTGKRRVKLDKR